jgi:hypothetical protein
MADLDRHTFEEGVEGRSGQKARPYLQQATRFTSRPDGEDTDVQDPDAGLPLMEQAHSTPSPFEQSQYERLRRCSSAVHGIARLIERDGLEKDSGRDGVLDAFTMGGLSHALTILSSCAEDCLDALENHAANPSRINAAEQNFS